MFVQLNCIAFTPTKEKDTNGLCFQNLHGICMQLFIDPCILYICSDEGSSNASSLALMEFYMKKAAHEEKLKQPRQSKDEMPPPPSLQVSTIDGDYSSMFLGLTYSLVKQFELKTFFY